MDKLKALRFEFVCQHVHASDIGAGSAKAIDKTYMHGIVAGDENDGYGCAVADFAASGEAGVPGAATTVTRCRTKSAASAGN